MILSGVGAASGGDTSEAEPERPDPAAGGGEEHPAGAAGGGRGGATQPGETAADSAGSGVLPQICRYSYTYTSECHRHTHILYDEGPTDTGLRARLKCPAVYQLFTRAVDVSETLQPIKDKCLEADVSQ